MGNHQGERATLWGNKGSGWHFIGQLQDGAKPINGWYYTNESALLVALDNGAVAYIYIGDSTSDPRADSNYRYQPSGTFDLGWYPGSIYEANKYWHSIFVDAECLSDRTKLEVFYSLDYKDAGCAGCIDDTIWTTLGEITWDQKELVLPCDKKLSGRAIRIKLVLSTKDPTVSPVVKAVGCKYAPKLNAQFRWSITLRLPANCLTDREGAYIDDYVQKTWDQRIKQIVSEPAPVSFVDLDSSEYFVVVSGFSRRVYNISCDSHDIDWSLSLLQVCPEGLV